MLQEAPVAQVHRGPDQQVQHQQGEQIEDDEVEKLQAGDVAHGEVEQAGEAHGGKGYRAHEAADGLQQAAGEQRPLRREQEKDNQPDEGHRRVENEGDPGVLVREILAKFKRGANMGRAEEAEERYQEIPDQNAPSDTVSQAFKHILPLIESAAPRRLQAICVARSDRTASWIR
jgi:hypothetical protein